MCSEWKRLGPSSHLSSHMSISVCKPQGQKELDATDSILCGLSLSPSIFSLELTVRRCFLSKLEMCPSDIATVFNKHCLDKYVNGEGICTSESRYI